MDICGLVVIKDPFPGETMLELLIRTHSWEKGHSRPKHNMCTKGRGSLVCAGYLLWLQLRPVGKIAGSETRYIGKRYVLGAPAKDSEFYLICQWLPQ